MTSQVRTSPSGPIVSVGAGALLGVVPNSLAAADANTRIIQAAIDASYANWLAGVNIAPVVLPGGTIWLGASTLEETYYNFHAAVPADSGCLTVRPGVTLAGQGEGVTILKPTSPTLTCINLVNGSYVCIRDIEIEADWTSSGAGHGILQVLPTDTEGDAVQGLRLQNIYVHDVGSYGIGLENGTFTDCLVAHFRTLNTGADGIDVKNRPLPNDSKGIVFIDFYIDSPGRRLDGQAGVDVRGAVEMTNITVVGVGRTASAEQSGIRMRTYGAAEGWGDKSTLATFYIRAADPTYDVGGLLCGSQNCDAVAGVIEDCANGVWLTGNGSGQSDNTNILGVQCINSTVRGFYVETNTENTSFVACKAVSCAIGFRNEGQNTSIVACSAPGSATAHSVSGGAIQTETLSANQFTTDRAVLTSNAVGRASVEARGGSANIDIALETKGTGVPRFGGFTASADAPVTGYITIRDSGGTVRRLAVIA